MSEAVSALKGVSREGAARVEETGLRGMVTVRGDLSSDVMAGALKSVLGADVPEVRRVEQGDKGKVAWMSPDELLVICDHDVANEIVAALQDALGGVHALVVNVSDARAVFRISGAGAREAMAKLAPVDVSKEAFGPGDFRRSRLAQVAAAFWMNEDESFEVICFRSVAQYVFDILALSGAKGGEVGFLA